MLNSVNSHPMAEVKGVMPQANPHYKPKTKRKRHVTKSAVGVVESRDDIRTDGEADEEASERSAGQSVKVVVSGGSDDSGAKGSDDKSSDDKSSDDPSDDKASSKDEE